MRRARASFEGLLAGLTGLGIGFGGLRLGEHELCEIQRIQTGALLLRMWGICGMCKMALEVARPIGRR